MEGLAPTAAQITRTRPARPVAPVRHGCRQPSTHVSGRVREAPFRLSSTLTYGALEVLRLADFDVSVRADDNMLVKVRAVAVKLADRVNPPQQFTDLVPTDASWGHHLLT